MTTQRILIALTLAASLGVAGAAQAAEGTPVPPPQKWSFSGPFGKFDQAQLQRGFKVYREVCANCHSMSRVAFRTLGQEGGPEFSEAQVKALAAEYKVKDGPNDSGEMFATNSRWKVIHSIKRTSVSFKILCIPFKAKYSEPSISMTIALYLLSPSKSSISWHHLFLP